MLIKQAVYTSLKSQRHHGYQLAATSANVTGDEARELSGWGPAHDSLIDPQNRSGSTNFHRLSGGGYCVSKSIPTGGEYSNRHGPRIFTHQFVLQPPALKRFAGDAFRVLDALIAAGHHRSKDELRDPMPTIRLVGGATACNHRAVSRVLEHIGKDRTLQLVDLVARTKNFGIISPLCGEQLMQGLINLLPPQIRPRLSFTTGLRCSTRRPFRAQILPSNRQAARREARRGNLVLHDLQAVHPPPQSPWSELVKSALDQPATDLLELQKLASRCESSELNDISAHVAAQV